MAINLATKYEGKIAEKFTKESYVKGNTSEEYSFVGVRSINIYTPQTVDLTNYDRTATMNRFGTPTEMQDEVQEMELSQEPSFSITIDKGNNEDQMNVKPALKMLGLQIREKVTPFIDKWAFSKWSQMSGQKAVLSTEPTKSTIVSAIFDGAAALDNKLVPDSERYIYLPTKYYNMVRLSSEFLAVDKLGEKTLSKGLVGMMADMKVIKVPDSYMPDGVYFLITHKKSVMLPNKIKTARVLTEVAGIDGSVLEGRNYFDAFVIGAKADGVYAAISSSLAVADPVLSISSHTASVTAASGVTFYYTLDGSDPRYSKTAQVYSSGVTTVSGQTIKVAGKKSANGFWSGVSESKDA